jgi:hypothetical protein
MALSLNDVNRVHSFTWVKCNDDAKSSFFRTIFIQKYGGLFTKKGRYWEWNPTEDQIIALDSSISSPAPKEIEPNKVWIFQNPEGKEIKTSNIQEFCKINKLTRSSLYEVISGKRKSHKGFVFIELKLANNS